eukprot:CAMPEP_0201552308 /NCGR_PEP_ID=MMETSP0173_2-20130828/14790_1 /ASSEMBLY_ACC=CAM_ASM_000268 /TAXON_ID=218659 /ORGANISM="Vexillifera sp., Strain DIVA3 564/2" /LENGTH=469 /DNA_ID=CAMNT_0047962765 /DNA_START=171 /DNA_END=1580 /DNA_ORIENTATION=+
MKATKKILDASGAKLNYEDIVVGESQYLAGNTNGIAPDDWDSLRKHKVMLKAPITTPYGGGYKSLNVTLRKSLGLFANVRPVQAMAPFVPTNFPGLDIVVVRENEEDLYAGIEHQQTTEVIQCLKLISVPGTERIVRYAFEYAKANNRKKVTCLVKDNIMKHTDGLYRTVFDEIGKEYPQLEKEVQIIDIGTAHLACRPNSYDVVVTSNLYGDIVSDVIAEIAGSVGMAGSFNLGENFAMFEAIHGSAPDIAGKDLANPSGLLQGAVHMLIYLNQGKAAERIQNAWLSTIESGLHTPDIYIQSQSEKMLGCQAFADAVIERMGETPKKLPVFSLPDQSTTITMPPYKRKEANKELVGVDVFLDWAKGSPDQLGTVLSKLNMPIKLKMITNRGVKVWPDGIPETFTTDHWRCRFVYPGWTPDSGTTYEEIEYNSVLQLLNVLEKAGLDVIKTENLYKFDGERAFSLGQGE